MGEVFKAHDRRLGRDVALKILPAAFSADAERLLRFEQEARAAAAINHPNILAVYDIGQEDGSPFIVSELLEGETLRETTAAALPVRRAVDYAIQIARGLSAAHDKGIVHRDLKPENVFVTTDGRVKILDFGLAKLVQPEATVTSASVLTTLPHHTVAGMVLGTMGYMSPEQARGLAADHRSDIFAFGALLYEMLSGRGAFTGETAADVLSAILKESPPDIPETRRVPPELTRIVDRCLEKTPPARFQTASDLAFALESISALSGSDLRSGSSRSALGSAGAAPASRRLAWIGGVMAAALLGAIAAAAALSWNRTPPDVRTMRLDLALPNGMALATISSAARSAAPLTLSPDGRRVAFVLRNAAGRDQIWIRSLDALAAQPLAGTDGAWTPFWSADSRSLAFFADGKLKKIDVAGGTPITLCDVGGPGVGGTWNQDGVILFGPGGNTALQKVSSSGGIATPATTLAPGEGGHLRPVFLPDGRHFFFRVNNGGIYVAALDSSDRTLVIEAPETSNIAYSDGHVLFTRESTLMAQPFDVERRLTTGDPFPIAEDIRIVTTGQPAALFTVSSTGLLAYQTGTGGDASQLQWINRTGEVIGALGQAGQPGQYGDLSLSPDGRRAVVSMIETADRGAQQTRDVWTIDVARGIRTRLTFDPADDESPKWSPDGTRIVFSSRRGGGRLNLYQKASSGAGSDELLLGGGADDKAGVSWSPDGRHILYVSTGAASTDLMVLPLDGERKPIPFLNTLYNEAPGQISPDGRWAAYGSNESGQTELYVTTFPKASGKWQVSPRGAGTGAVGSNPRWRRDGKELYYVDPDNMLMAAAVNGDGASVEVGAARPLFRAVPGGPRYFYDATADGQRFLVNTLSQVSGATQSVTVVVNWAAGIAD